MRLITLRLTVFICGAALMALELVGSRILAPSFGNSLFTWGSLISVVMTALSIGYYWGGKAADKNPTFNALSDIIMKAGIITAFIPLLTSILINPTIVLVLGIKYGPLISAVLLFALPSFLLGMVSPYAIKLVARDVKTIGNSAGDMYALSTIGSISGTFITAFVLIPLLGVKIIVYSISLILIVAALLISKQGKISMAIYTTAILLILFAITSVYPLANSGQDRIVFQGDTPYYQITVVDWDNSTKRRLMLDNSLTGGIYLNSSDTLYEYFDYLHLPLVIKPNITDVLFIGGGAGVGPKNFHEKYGWMNIDVVDIDEKVNKIAVEYFGMRGDDKLRLYVADGRVFLTNSRKKYDLIVVDAFNSISSIPFHLMTREFIEELKGHLNDDGIVVLNMHSSVEGDASDIFRWEYRTYKGVFPNVYVFPLKQDFRGVMNIVIIASKSDRWYSREEFIELANKSAERIGIRNIVNYSKSYFEKDIPTENSQVLTDDYAPVENLLIPVLNSEYRLDIEYFPVNPDNKSTSGKIPKTKGI